MNDTLPGPSFMNVSNSSLIITLYPTLASQIGTYQIYLTISDTVLNSTSYFYVTVTDRPAPYFTSVASLSNQTVKLNSIGTYVLPPAQDPQVSTILYSYQPSYNFITISNNIFTFAPN